MTFSLISSKKFLSDDIRDAFADMVQTEIAARDPVEGVDLLQEAEQMEFSFSFDKK